jgi:cytochrome c biogenesis protein CcmG, thiol:disulfide interchange protein DsbE
VKNRTAIIVVGAIVLVAGLAGLAVLLSGGDDESSGGVLAPGQTTEATAGGDVQENRPVTVTGAPLPALERDGAPDAALGMATPVIEGATFDGEPLTIGGATDGPTLYAFLAHWCPHCNQEVPELIELRNRDGIPEGMNVVGVSTGVDNTGPNYPPSKWLADSNWPTEWPVMADSAASEAFAFNGGGGFPYLMIVDADGTVLARERAVMKSAEDLAAFIQAALAAAA